MCLSRLRLRPAAATKPAATETLEIRENIRSRRFQARARSALLAANPRVPTTRAMMTQLAPAISPEEIRPRAVVVSPLNAFPSRRRR